MRIGGGLFPLRSWSLATLSVDAEDRPTRITYALSVPQAGAEDPARLAFEWTFSGWDETDVHVEQPPESRVGTPPDCA
jgi:hypothetical protein